MKLKITEPGWEGFSGNLGIVLFKDGVSVGEVSHVEANIISGNIRVVELESGDNVGALELDADAQNKSCVQVTYQTMDQILAGQPSEDVAVAVESQEPAAAQVFTKESLEKIADEKGIAGLRVIGDSLGVKGTSISGLIEAILQKQNPEPVVAPLQEGQPVETKEQAE